MQVTTLTSIRTGKPGTYEIVSPGNTLKLAEEEARSLIDRGIVIPNQTSESQPDVLVDAIVDAIDDLPQDAFGKDGKPNVKAIEDILGQNISAADRDKAWATYQTLVNDG